MMLHKTLTPEQWFQFSTFEQLANVGADIEQTIVLKNQHNMQYNQVFIRALELLSWTIIDPKNKGPQRKELCRVREMLVDHFMFDNTYNTTDEEWPRYFYPFSCAAKVEQERKRAQNVA